MNVLKPGLLFILLVLSGLSNAQLQIENYPSLVIMGVSADEGTLPSSDPIYKRVTDQLAQQMSMLDFSTYLENAKTRGEFAYLTTRTEKDIAMIASSMPDVDILVQFTIYLYAEDTLQQGMQSLKARIAGKLQMVGSGEFLDTFETKSSQAWRLKKSCVSVCLTESVGEYASLMAQDLGNVLAEKLDYIVNLESFDYTYRITTEHVEKAEIDQLMQFLSQRQISNLARDKTSIVFDSILPRRHMAGRLSNYFNKWSLPTKLTINGNIFNLSVDYRSEQKPKTKTKKDPASF